MFNYAVKCGGSELVTLRCAPVVCELFCAKGNVSCLAAGSRETSAPPLTTSRTWIRCLAHSKRLSDLTSFDLSFGQDKLLFTKHICSSYHLAWPFEAPRHLTSLLAQMSHVPIFPFCLWNSHACRISDCLMYAEFLHIDYSYFHIYIIY